MTSLVVFSVPLYKIFCEVTGFKGFNKIDLEEKFNAKQNSSLNFQFIFDAHVSDELNWSFDAPSKMNVEEGKKYSVLFKAKNNSNVNITGTSTFNVLPPKISPYLTKIECFCFLDQPLEPSEIAEFPVTFYIDPLIRNDPEASKVRNVTLSYTFFPKID
tara:strand:- start:5211 stop:5687 length:477 start_codon:yes stop_codon:yes gene_type:complete